MAVELRKRDNAAGAAKAALGVRAPGDKDDRHNRVQPGVFGAVPVLHRQELLRALREPVHAGLRPVEERLQSLKVPDQDHEPRRLQSQIGQKCSYLMEVHGVAEEDRVDNLQKCEETVLAGGVAELLL